MLGCWFCLLLCVCVVFELEVFGFGFFLLPSSILFQMYAMS